jgi:hypothetical protein
MYLPPWAFNMQTISIFDFDGVIYFGDNQPGVRPGPDDILITGRSFQEREKTEAWCKKFGITNQIFFSQVPEKLKTREISGYHKAITLRELLKTYSINLFFEDDPIQKEIIEAMVPDVRVVHLVHELTEK